MTRMLRLYTAAATHPGLQRQSNEDYYAVAEELALLAVADGLGGHPAGDVAAKIAVDTLRETIANPEATWPDDAIEDPEEVLARVLAAFASANRRVREHARQRKQLTGMATTLVAAQVVPGPGRLVVAHLGDSRAYVQRGSRLERITEDHRVASDASVRACLTPEALSAVPPNTLTRAIGTRERVNTEVRIVELVPGDTILLATDGLTAVVGDDEIAAVIDDLHDLGAAASALIERANRRGGPDNITVVLGRWAYA